MTYCIWIGSIILFLFVFNQFEKDSNYKNEKKFALYINAMGFSCIFVTITTIIVLYEILKYLFL